MAAQHEVLLTQWTMYTNKEAKNASLTNCNDTSYVAARADGRNWFNMKTLKQELVPVFEAGTLL